MQSSRAIWAFADWLESKIGERGILLAFMAPAIVIVIAAQFYPLFYSLYISFVDWTLTRSIQPGPFVGLANYAKMATDSVLQQTIGRTLIFAVASTTATTIIGFVLAYFTVGERPAVRIARTILILPMVIAPVAVGTIWRMMLSARVGPINEVLRGIGLPTPDWLGDPTLAMLSIIIIDVWEWTPFVFVIFAAAISSLPSEVLRAAEVDGAAPVQILF